MSIVQVCKFLVSTLGRHSLLPLQSPLPLRAQHGPNAQPRLAQNENCAQPCHLLIVYSCTHHDDHITPTFVFILNYLFPAVFESIFSHNIEPSHECHVQSPEQHPLSLTLIPHPP